MPILLALLVLALIGCVQPLMDREGTQTPVVSAPESGTFTEIGHGSGEACLSALFGLIPLGATPVTIEANRRAVDGGEVLTNVREHRSYYWIGFYDRTCVTREGTILRRNR